MWTIENLEKDNAYFYEQSYYKERDIQNDWEILQERENTFNQIEGARVGDYVIMPDGSYERFAYDWHDSLQTCRYGSFHIGKYGHLEMSGSLNPSIKRELLELTEEKKLGSVWFFSQGWSGAHRGVDCKILFRVFRVKEAPQSC